MNKRKVEGIRIFLEEIDEKILKTSNYIKWVNDKDITKYLEYLADRTITEDELISYLKSIDKSKSFFAGIFLKINGRHIGNIHLNRINLSFREAHIGIMIGEKEYHGKGYALEALNLMVSYAFDNLQLIKLSAGIYSGNIKSKKLFEKAGFFFDKMISNPKSVINSEYMLYSINK